MNRTHILQSRGAVSLLVLHTTPRGLRAAARRALVRGVCRNNTRLVCASTVAVAGYVLLQQTSLLHAPALARCRNSGPRPVDKWSPRTGALRSWDRRSWLGHDVRLCCARESQPTHLPVRVDLTGTHSRRRDTVNKQAVVLCSSAPHRGHRGCRHPPISIWRRTTTRPVRH